MNNNSRVILLLISVLSLAGIGFWLWPTDGDAQRVSQEKTTPPLTITGKTLWKVSTPSSGFSSPRAADLNGDGVLDIVIGSGEETGIQERYIYAVDGATGQILWNQMVYSRVFASASFVDITQDQVPDVIIGTAINKYMGASLLHNENNMRQILPYTPTGKPSPIDIAQKTGHSELFGDLLALDGRDGKRIWSVMLKNPHFPFSHMDFNTVLLTPDIDSDGIQDIIAVQSGGDDRHRSPARMYWLSSVSGKIIRVFRPPGNEEIYSIPILLTPEKSNKIYLLYGTGGETLPGHMALLDMKANQILWKIPTLRKGFVASPILHATPQNPLGEILGASFEGTLYKIAGDTGSIVWKSEYPETETYVSPAFGRFNGDDTLDAIAIFSEGTVPRYRDETFIVWIDGQTGQPINRISFGTQTSCSPLVIDFNGDGLDEILAVANQSWPFKSIEELETLMSEALKKEVAQLEGPAKRDRLKAFMAELANQTINRVSIFDGKDQRVIFSMDFDGFTAATPLVVDLDGNGKLDLIHVFTDTMVRVELEHPPNPQVKWNQYRGPRADGIFQ